MNARLAARLTGWKVDIQSDTEFATERGRGGLRRRRRGRGVHRPLRRDALERQALPERGAARLALLRRPGAPGARAARAECRRSSRSSESEPELERRRASPRPRRRPDAEPEPATSRRVRDAVGRAPATRATRGRVELDVRSGRRRPRGRSRSSLDSDAGRGGPALRERADQDVRRLRPQGAAGRAPALRRARRRADARAEGPGTRRLHLPPAAPASSGRRTRRAFNRTLRQTVRVDPELARLYTERRMADRPEQAQPPDPAPPGGAGRPPQAPRRHRHAAQRARARTRARRAIARSTQPK